MENSSSDDRSNRSNQNRQGQRGGRRRQNNRGDNRNNRSGDGSSNRRSRSGGSSNRNQGGGKREYRPSNRGRQVAPKQTFIQKILSFLGLGGDSKSKTATASKAPSSKREGSGNRQSSRSNNRSDEKVEVNSTRLYVGNLDYKTTGPDLEKHFSQIGSVKSAEIVINRRTQQSKGFAFVEMSSIEEARKAVSSYHNEDFMGRRMLVNGAKSSGAGGEGGRSSSNERRSSERRDNSDSDRNRRNDRGGDRNQSRRSETREEPRREKKTEAPVIITSSRLKLDNLDYEVGEDELEELFKGIGVVVNTEVAANPDTHQSKGYGFVEMSHIDEAKRAVEILNNKDFMGRRLNISGAEATAENTPAVDETVAEESAVVEKTATEETITEATDEEKTETEAPETNQDPATVQS